MKKRKILALFVALVAVIGLAACGGGGGGEVAEKDFSGDYTDTGAGTIEVITPSGSSADGTVPLIMIEPNTLLDSIGLNAWEFDGSKISYIYVDGMLQSKEQLADTQTSVELRGDMLAEGEHSVEVVQYDNDDPSGNVVTYKSAAYEIKLL